MNAKQYREQRKQQHLSELASLGLVGSYRSLRRLECKANRAATDWCNGDMTYEAFRSVDQQVMKAVRKLFGGRLPDGFLFNSDPRGYALKISDKSNKLRQRDWGGYGILAPDNDSF